MRSTARPSLAWNCGRAPNRIARRGVEDKRRLGRYRWVVERTLAWLARYCRLAIRYERHETLQLAFLDLACALLYLNALARF